MVEAAIRVGIVQVRRPAAGAVLRSLRAACLVIVAAAWMSTAAAQTPAPADAAPSAGSAAAATAAGSAARNNAARPAPAWIAVPRAAGRLRATDIGLVVNTADPVVVEPVAEDIPAVVSVAGEGKAELEAIALAEDDEKKKAKKKKKKDE